MLVLAALVAAAEAGAATNYVAEAESLLAKGQLRAAEIQLKNAVRSDPTDMQAHYRLALVQLQLGEAAAAEHEAQAARAGGYDPDRTVPLLAQTYLLQQKYKQLLNDFPENQGGVTERAGVLVARGYAQLALGSPEEARKMLKAAEELTPDAPQPLLAEAKLLASEHQFDAAERLFDQALKLEPNSNEARTGKADLLRVHGKSDQALAMLDAVISGAPAYVPARLERAEILVSQGKDELAKADVQAVLTAQPGSVAGIYLDALLAAKVQDFEKANTNLQKISGAMALIPRAYYTKSVVDYRLGHLDQAADAAQRYVARNPDDLAGKKLLGYIDLELHRPGDAIDALSKFETEGKADAEALALLGRSYTQVGKPAEALAAFSAAVKLAPTNAGLKASLGEAELRAGHRSEAITDLEQSLNLAPSVPAAEMLVLMRLADGDWQGATDAATKLQQTEPNSPVSGNLLGLIKLARFDIEGARTQFAELVRKDPEFLPARLNLARTLELEEKQDESLTVLNEALAKQPANGVVLSRVIELLLRRGTTDGAISAAERAHQAAPDNLGITVGLIDLYVRGGANDKALAMARQQTQNNGNNPLLIAARARAEFAAGLKNEATASYRRLIEMAPSQIGYRQQLASVLLSAGDVEGAQRAIEEAMELDNNNPQLAADLVAITLKKSGVAGAVATANQLRSRHRNLATAPALEGDAYMAGKEYQKAADAYSKELQQTPSAMLVLRLAQAKAGAGDREGAASVLREWLSNHPDDRAVSLVLVSYDLAAQRFDQAKAELEHILEKDPRNVVALNNLAWLYQRAGDPRARSLAERAYLLAPNLAQTADTLGWILVQEGQPAIALALLKEANGVPSAAPAIRYHLAVALNDSGHPEDAVPLLSEIVKPDVDFDEKPNAAKLLTKLSKR
jgi:putative PEP-CTERM system TPR-repeat lipoprotein